MSGSMDNMAQSIAKHRIREISMFMTERRFIKQPITYVHM